MSDQDSNSLNKLLQEHDLSPDKWEPLFHKEGITTKAHITSKTEGFVPEALLSKAYTEKEKQGLRKLFSTDSETERELAEAGLEPTAHWLSIFKTQLGVRTPQGLQHIGSESYADLERFAQNPWEKKALRKLVGMKDEETSMKSLRQKQKEKLQQRKEKSQQLLEELKDLQIKHNESRLKQLMNSVKEALQVPEGSWKANENSPEALLSGLKAIVKHMDQELKGSTDLSDVEVLQHASGGRALQGILVSSDVEDQFEIRQNLLSPPQDAQLKAPSLCQDDKIEQFSSQCQEKLFIQSMNRLGYSAAASAKAGFLGLGVHKGASYSKAIKTKMVDDYQLKEMYYSTIKYSFVPMASFHFKDSQLQLSADALRKLEAIEKLIESGTDLQEECEFFFRKYGSHANKGHLHFGGIYWLRCYTYGFQESDLTEINKLHSQAVSASIGLLLGEFGASVEGKVATLKENFKGSFSEALVSQTTVEVTKHGGSQLSNIPLWKSSLVASNFTWSVVDRGSNTVPVWEIIQVHICLNDVLALESNN